MVERCVRDAEVTGSNPAAPTIAWKAVSSNVFSRFNPAAKRVLRTAEQACRNDNHYYVGVEHLLCALLEERDPELEARLARAGIARESVYSAVRQALGTGDDRLWEGILITPRVRRVVRIAGEAAGARDEVTPLHLFDAIVSEGGSAAADIVRQAARDVSGAAG